MQTAQGREHKINVSEMTMFRKHPICSSTDNQYCVMEQARGAWILFHVMNAVWLASVPQIVNSISIADFPVLCDGTLLTNLMNQVYNKPVEQQRKFYLIIMLIT